MVLVWILTSLVLTAMFVWPIVVIPRVERSLFRYKLWRIRDEIVDDTDAGKIQDCEYGEFLVDFIEWMIREADDISLARLIPAIIRDIQGDLPTPEIMKVRARLREDAEPSSRDELDVREHEAHRALATYLAKGSVLGWMIGGAAILVTSVRGLFRGRRVLPKDAVLHSVERPADVVSKLPRPRTTTRDEHTAAFAGL